MGRRTFIQRLVEVLAFSGLFFLIACKGKEKSAAFGNQEKLWQLVSGEQQGEEPIVPSYSKETPALYRDASMGKADPNFVPRVSGG